MPGIMLWFFGQRSLLMTCLGGRFYFIRFAGVAVVFSAHGRLVFRCGRAHSMVIPVPLI